MDVMKALRCHLFLATLLVLPFDNYATAAERRVALVIGNAAYVHASVLNTPINDARLLAKRLREMGFAEVFERYNVGLRPMAEALDAFGARAENADWAVLYFAGHGLQIGGTTYLVPIDARLASQANVPQETIDLDRIVVKSARVQTAQLLLLDISRNNPFGSAARSLRTTPPASPQGRVFIAFATGPGSKLSETRGDNGPFALALTRHLAFPAADLHEVFKRIRDDVVNATNGLQLPWTLERLPDAAGKN
jgi:uncharacterized caspase-like protein